MAFDRRTLIKGGYLAAASSAVSAISGRAARAQNGTIKIGVLTDLSGFWSASSGQGSVACVAQAAAEFASANNNLRVEVLSADHQNKPDVAMNIAKQWYDVERVDAIIDVPSNGAALAVSEMTKARDKVFLASSPSSPDLTERSGSPNTIHWTYNTWMVAAAVTDGVIKQGDKAWYFVTSDTTFETNLERDITAFVKRAGGSVVGSMRVPIDQSPNISNQLTGGQVQQAQVVALATPVGVTDAILRQISELKSKKRIAAPLMLINDVHTLGLGICQKIILCEAYYWNLNNRTRALASRLQSSPRNSSTLRDWRPGMMQAGCYSAALHYLKTVAGMSSGNRSSGRDVVARMKAMPTDDDAFGSGKIRDDGRKLHPVACTRFG